MSCPPAALRQRHHLVWLDDAGWAQVQSAAADARERQALQRWQQEQWPLVLRRADPDAGADEVCAAVALPPDVDGDKLRIAVRVPQAHVQRLRAPLTLAEVIAAQPALPGPWHLPLLALQQAGLPLRVFGSLSWQVLTGQPYLRAQSDIDLLWQPSDSSALEQGIRLLQRHARHLPLDGEILFAGGDAVAWKEWAQADQPAARVLVKGARGVRLERIDALHCAPEQEQSCTA
ncbi:malonate decarboxylase holo-[acyl-carrier-protein] synthase [Herbaspirillum sp. alder98]|uniref:malonate decarboxylase holo-[acyl-carrier-protein] synthase n=1 Tax=Herbaspirillum sp. alder98 TaxID=2913096 RepID=UPI001CD8D5F3|nr:malonate decarboxylase holo-[acyl-carrier-protein] synthase [Herbaspirillum sp. alder98]MCA1326606.1 malonate decarboxylase holo-[acyl-carrier-protein] synthase [Herbaspirillum sp. alder98]